MTGRQLAQKPTSVAWSISSGKGPNSLKCLQKEFIIITLGILGITC